MKRSFVVLLILISFSSYSQIIVNSKTDNRLISYQDSLKKYWNNEKQKHSDSTIIESINGHDPFTQIMRLLGYKPNSEFPERIWDNKTNSNQKLELFYCCEHCLCFYRVIIPKPKIIVKYQPEEVKIENKFVRKHHTTFITYIGNDKIVENKVEIIPNK